MSAYFVKIYRVGVTRAHAAHIDRAIRAVDAKAGFVRHYAAGNDVHGWIERPDDGSNDDNWRKERNRQLIAIADEMLGVRK